MYACIALFSTYCYRLLKKVLAELVSVVIEPLGMFYTLHRIKMRNEIIPTPSELLNLLPLVTPACIYSYSNFSRSDYAQFYTVFTITHPVIYHSLSMFRLPWNFRDARIVQNLHCRSVSDIFPVLQHPNYLLIWRYFDKLGAFASIAT